MSNNYSPTATVTSLLDNVPLFTVSLLRVTSITLVTHLPALTTTARTAHFVVEIDSSQTPALSAQSRLNTSRPSSLFPG